MSALAELTCLALQRPPAESDPATVARFYDTIARVHDHLAEEATGVEATSERSYALAARLHADALRSTIPDPRTSTTNVAVLREVA